MRYNAISLLTAGDPAVLHVMDTRTLRLIEYDKIRGMLHRYAASPLGKELIDRMRPVRDIALVRARLAETSEARRIINDRGDAPFGGLRDMREAVRRAEKQAVLSAAELLDTADTAACIRRLRRYLIQSEGYPLLAAQGRLLVEFPHLERAIDQAINAQGEVMDSASPELDRARRRVRGLHDEIHRELQRIITSPSMLDQLQEPIITQRNGRFCVPVRAEARNIFKGILHDLSASGQTVFMEPLSVVELGNDLREAQRREEEEVQRVLASLSAMVGATAVYFLANLDTAARLDAIFARAQYARALDATAPEVNADGIIDLKQARHPLLGEKAVPIDIALGEDGFHSLLITGPNTGGKTVTLKTVGLLTMMAQSGLQIPASEGSRVAVFDMMFADIGDEQSIEQSLSTFSGHMTQIVRIVKETGPRSLVLLDEIGAGTDPSEGAALGKAILLELAQRGCRTIATTHYGELKVFAQTTEGFLNASVEFDLESLRPTYRVIIGLPGSSNAFSISQRLGLPKPIVARAREMIGESPQAFEQVLKQAEGTRRALDRERTAASRARHEAEKSAEQLKQEQKKLDEKREASLARAREQAQQVLQKTRQDANALLDELKDAIREYRESARTAAPPPDAAAIRRKSREVLAAITEEVGELPAPPPPPRPVEKPSLTSVAAGQLVFVRSVGHRGIALEAGTDDQEVEVQVGLMRVRVPVSDLEASANKAAESPWATLAEAPRRVEPEIHLLGLRVEEASDRLDDYLYDALDCGITKVRIIHGFGTGALRNSVQDLLRHHPAVRSYRQADPRDGGGGVTMAELGVGPAD
ncbi:MAG: endonuclease MutS2 [Armatimonadota bacterium]